MSQESSNTLKTDTHYLGISLEFLGLLVRAIRVLVTTVATIVSISGLLDVTDEIFGSMSNQCSSTGLGVEET